MQMIYVLVDMQMVESQLFMVGKASNLACLSHLGSVVLLLVYLFSLTLLESKEK